MKTVLTTTIVNQQFYLSHDNLATDLLDNARTFRDLTDATIGASRQNFDEAWSRFGIRWTPEQVLFSEEQERVNQWRENDRPLCHSHR